jgi:hypothetical protein
MNVSRTYRVLDMLRSVFEFGRANADKFPQDSFGGQAFAALGEGVGKLTAQRTQLNVAQRHALASTNGREAAREALAQQLEAISLASIGISIDVPGMDRKFTLPDHPYRDKALIQTGAEFLQAAAPLKEHFVGHQLPADFLESLRAAVEGLDKAVAEKKRVKESRSEATLEFDNLMDTALTNLQRLDAIVPNVLRNDSRIGAWQVARRVAREARSRKTGAKKPEEANGSKAVEEKPEPEQEPASAAPDGQPSASGAS